MQCQVRTQPVHFTYAAGSAPLMCDNSMADAPMIDAKLTTYAMKSQNRWRQKDAESNASYDVNDDLQITPLLRQAPETLCIEVMSAGVPTPVLRKKGCCVLHILNCVM